MQIHSLKSRKLKSKKRVGRGGKRGTYSGKGMKGQKSRSGYSKRATFEGGRTTLVAQTKKARGFTSKKDQVQVVNLEEIQKKYKSGEEVSPKTLGEKNIVKKSHLPIKILSVGKLAKKVILKDVAYSKEAKKKVEKAGGEVR